MELLQSFGKGPEREQIKETAAQALGALGSVGRPQLGGLPSLQAGGGNIPNSVRLWQKSLCLWKFVLCVVFLVAVAQGSLCLPVLVSL